MGIRLDKMLVEIETRLKKDYDEEMWTGRIRIFWNIIGKEFEPELIVNSHFAMTLMDLRRLKEIAKDNSELAEFCNVSVESVHAQLVGWMVAPYMADWFTGINKAY
jgi:hypothetical protein